MAEGSTSGVGATAAGLEVAAAVCRGTPVLRLTGRLSRPGLVQCRAAIDNAIAAGAPYLVVDLREVTFDPSSVALLGLVRRYCSRRQTTVVLAGVPHVVRDMLRQARVSDLYRSFPTVADALDALVRSRPGEGDRSLVAV